MMSESGAKMVHATFSYLHLQFFWYANVAFTIFAQYLLRSFYIFATYLQGVNLGKSNFRLAFYLAVYFTEEK